MYGSRQPGSEPGVFCVLLISLSDSSLSTIPRSYKISIITLPLHEKPYHFRLNRKQIKQAQRNGVMVGDFLFHHPPLIFLPLQLCAIGENKIDTLSKHFDKHSKHVDTPLNHADPSSSYYTLQAFSPTLKPRQTSRGDIARTSCLTRARSFE